MPLSRTGTAALTLALAMMAPACIHAASYDQLKETPGGQLAANVPAPAPVAPPARASGRWPTGGHPAFATALDFNYRTKEKDGDYYPFAGTVSGKTYDDEITDPVYGDPSNLGLAGGMASENGHPSLLNNGGDPRFFWERALRKFKDGLFAAAYSDIGIVCHLTQDQAIPAHAANINHVITLGDKFEKAAGKNMSLIDKLKGTFATFRVPDMEPYEYYQALQDDTRRHLPEWVNPATGKPYWPPAADAPPLGQDSTKGPWSHYSGRKDTYDKKVSPEIMERQMMMAAVYTQETLKAAARRLPPAILKLKALRSEKDRRSVVNLSFDLYDNRKGEIEVEIERPLYGMKMQKEVHVESNGRNIPGSVIELQFPKPSAVITADDVIIVTARDQDGNVSRAETTVKYKSRETYDDMYYAP